MGVDKRLACIGGMGLYKLLKKVKSLKIQVDCDEITKQLTRADALLPPQIFRKSVDYVCLVIWRRWRGVD